MSKAMLGEVHPLFLLLSPCRHHPATNVMKPYEPMVVRSYPPFPGKLRPELSIPDITQPLDFYRLPSLNYIAASAPLHPFLSQQACFQSIAASLSGHASKAQAHLQPILRLNFSLHQQQRT